MPNPWIVLYRLFGNLYYRRLGLLLKLVVFEITRRHLHRLKAIRACQARQHHFLLRSIRRKRHRLLIHLHRLFSRPVAFQTLPAGRNREEPMSCAPGFPTSAQPSAGPPPAPPSASPKCPHRRVFYLVFLVTKRLPQNRQRRRVANLPKNAQQRAFRVQVLRRRQRRKNLFRLSLVLRNFVSHGNYRLFKLTPVIARSGQLQLNKCPLCPAAPPPLATP